MNSYYKNQTTEAQEQTALFRWADFAMCKYPELALLYHIPNEGKRSRSTGYNLKLQGLKSGVPDLCLPVARGKYHGLYIEMKQQNGKVSKTQSQWITKLEKQNYRACVCYGWVEASELITSYLEIGECKG